MHRREIRVGMRFGLGYDELSLTSRASPFPPCILVPSFKFLAALASNHNGHDGRPPAIYLRELLTYQRTHGNQGLPQLLAKAF
jgi:hypothetical protein